MRRRLDSSRIASWQENHRYDCWEVAAKDQSEALATYVQVLAGANVRSRRIRLKGLDENAVYRVEGAEGTEGETELLLSGDCLMYAGLRIPDRKGDFAGQVFHLVRVEEAE